MNWLLLIAIAQLLYAITAVIDKYIVSAKMVARPLLYAIYVSLLSAFSVVIFLFDPIVKLFRVALPENYKAITFGNVSLFPNFEVLILSLIIGFSIFGAFYMLFTSLKYASASDSIPVIVSSSAVTTLILGALILGTDITRNFLIGFVMLAGGTLIISRFRFVGKTLFYCVAAGALFAINDVAFKFLSIETNFSDALFWSRFAIVLVPIIIIILNKNHQEMKEEAMHTSVKGGAMVIGNKILAGIAGFLVLISIDLADQKDLPLLKSMEGLRFIYLLLFAYLFGRNAPKVCDEGCSRREIWQKTIAVIVMFLGLFVLFDVPQLLLR